MFFSLDIFGPGSSVEYRFIKDHARLLEIVRGVRQTRCDLKIVMTQGSYDLLHIGHGRYLEDAKTRGAVVIVGLDTDEGIKLRKGPHRPIQPEEERIEMLCHLRHVDLVALDTDFIKEGDRAGHTQFSLVKLIQPDVFIASERSYDDSQLRILGDNSGEVVTLPSQAETSTSAQLMKFMKEVGDEVKGAVDARLQGLGDSVKEAIDQKMGGLRP